jgi:hypothetical protein
MINEMGGLPEFYYRDFKKGFKRGFMETCKTKKSKHVRPMIPKKTDRKHKEPNMSS